MDRTAAAANCERDRRVVFSRVTNFRDLGGYRTLGGGETRWGEVFRSDSLHNLVKHDLASFDALGVRVVYDLRRHDERQREPSPLACIHVELPSNRVDDADPGRLRTRGDGERWLFEDYRGMLERAGHVFGQLFAELAHAPGPAVFHCTGGKDRTGLTAALLLSCLGVDREVVLDDYELTSRYRVAKHSPAVVELFVAMGIPRPAAEGLLSAPRWAMAEALEVLDTKYGGIRSYLVVQGGMLESYLDALTERLVA